MQVYKQIEMYVLLSYPIHIEFVFTVVLSKHL